MRIAAERHDEAARLTLSWKQPVSVEQRQEGRELTLRFGRPIGDAAVDGIPKSLSGWVENAQYGYDSLLLVLAPDVAATATLERTGVRLDFQHARPAGPELFLREKTEAAAERRLDYYRALTTMELGEVRAARDRMEELVRADPRDRDMIELLAQAEERLGRWREAVKRYDEALALSPGRKEDAEAKARLLREYGDRVRLDTDVVHVRGADTQRIARLSGSRELGANTTFRFVLEERQLTVDRIPPGGGPPNPFHGTRTRGELSVAHDWDTPQRTRASLYLASQTVGFGVGHALLHESGETRASVTWHEPAYTFIEGIIGGGWRDRVALAHDERLWQGLTASLGGALNRYGLAGDPDLARSASLEGALRYTVFDASADGGPIASIAYILDAEYVGRKVERVDPRGAVFAPLPLVTREVHSFQLELDHPVNDWFRYTLQGGYSYDRRNKGGPFAAAALAVTPLADLEFGLRASHTIGTARGTGNVVDSAGGYLLWHY